MTTTTRAPKPHLLDASDPGAAEAAYFNAPFGLFGRRKIKAMAGRKLIRSGPAFDDGQFQPASLDLRLGKEAYRVRASFLPGRGRSVKEHLESFDAERIALTGEGAVLERGIVYVARLAESLALLPSISGAANPKSSTGRLDIFTRLIVDGAEAFDEVPLGYRGELWLEISPRSFSVRVHEGSRLSQIRFRSRNSQQMDRHDFTLQGRSPARSPSPEPAGRRRTDDARRRAAARRSRRRRRRHRRLPRDQEFERHRRQSRRAATRRRISGSRSARAPTRRLILDPDEFYILASREKVQIPADLAAEMAPIDPAIGEFRVHYAGFFDPGFGQGPDGAPCARAVLEVRSRDVPFLLEDGQPVGRLVYEALGDAPEREELYGAGATSNYQGQGLKLGKHFRDFKAP